MSGNHHELLMMALTAFLSIIVGFLAGRIWEAFCAFDEEAQISREEIALISANRLRLEREQAAPKKPPVSVNVKRFNAKPERRTMRRKAAGGR